MNKSVAPRKYQFLPIGHTVANFDESIPVPSMRDGPIWMAIDIPPSFYGKIVAMLYRPPHLSLTVYTRNGRFYSGRLLSMEARAGFLVSPVINNRQSFFALASTNWLDELADLEVTSARITADGEKALASHYQSPPVQVHFFRLDFQRPQSPEKSFAGAGMFDAAD